MKTFNSLLKFVDDYKEMDKEDRKLAMIILNATVLSDILKPIVQENLFTTPENPTKSKRRPYHKRTLYTKYCEICDKKYKTYIAEQRFCNKTCTGQARRLKMI